MAKQSFVVLPAAGHGRRMKDNNNSSGNSKLSGRSKLLLPWKDHTIIDEVLSVWTTSAIAAVVVIVRRGDKALQKAIRRWPGVELLAPEEDPPEMKKSIRVGLHYLQATRSIQANDRWLIAPSDLPTLSASVIGEVIAASQSTDQIVAPRFDGRNGHPVSLPWALVPHIDTLPPDQGINHLIDQHSVHWVNLPPDQYPADIDTPDDYRNLK